MTQDHHFMTLTRVSAGTPMGKLLRRYWLPVLLGEQLAERGGAPVRARLLGENLVGFRSPDGTLGLVGEHCPHRGASLAYGRNEDGGLRCHYHGWKIDGAGTVVETPAEPANSRFKERICHKHYPVHEAGGIVWTYMGPPELKPAFPAFPWLGLDDDHVLVVKMFQDCSFLQGLEGDYDPAHPNYLHRDFELEKDKSWSGAGWNSIALLMGDGRPAIECEETPQAMRFAAIRKTPDPAMNYVRVFESCAPLYCYPAAGPHESRAFKGWQPIDDETCFTFYVHFDPLRPLDKEAIYENWGHRNRVPDHRIANGVGNGHLQSRDLMRRTFSGIHGAAVQDLAVQESMGPIYDRAKENLATSDRAVVFYRRHMQRLIERNEAGLALPGLDAAIDFDQRGSSIYMPAGVPWQQARQYQEEYERQNPPS